MTIFEHYKHYCTSFETTDLYAEFSFYSLIGACLQRRVWIKSDTGIFPNTYLIFVGNPGTGKTNAGRFNDTVLKLLLKPDPRNPAILKQAVNIAPDSVTVEMLIKKMADISDAFKDQNGNWHGHASMTFVAEELGSLIRKNDENLVRFLIQAYDGKDYLRETLGRGADKINRPCVNFLASTIPGWMSSALANNLLDDGFVGRALFIWGGPLKNLVTFYRPTIEQNDSFRAILEHCKYLVTVNGELKVPKETDDFIDNWYKYDKNKIINPDKKLVNYYSRKKINAIKLAICNHYANWPVTNELTIRDFQLALESLKRAEINMHLAFSSTGSNPIYKLSNSILQFLQRTGRAFTWEQLRKLFFDECSLSGTTADVNSSIEYLQLCGKVKIETNEKKEICVEAVKEN